MFRVFVLDGNTWRKVAGYDQLEAAFEMRDHYREDGYETEVVIRLKEGYYVVEDDGNTHPLGAEPHPPTAA